MQLVLSSGPFRSAPFRETAMDRHERALHFALTRVRDEIPFGLYKVTSPFCPTASFSSVTFDLAAHVDVETQSTRLALPFDSLFNVDVDVKPASRETLEFISTSRKHLWPPLYPDPTFKPSERAVVLKIASEILVPLCKEVLLEKRARAALSSHLSGRQSLALKLRCADLGLGTVKTWHGTPDLRVRGGV